MAEDARRRGRVQRRIEADADRVVMEVVIVIRVDAVDRY